MKDKCITKLSKEREVLQAQLDDVRPTLGSTKVTVVDEPLRTPEKCHWDYLLAEVMWLREDIVSERKWKSSQWKKLDKELGKHKYIVDRASGVDLTEQYLLKTSAFLANEVEKFWKGITQLAAHRVSKLQAELKRVDNQKRLDQLVHRTELLVRDEDDDTTNVAKRPRVEPQSHELLDSITAEMTKAQPQGNSFATMQISVPVPSLFRGQMREYQHIGMQWLSTLHDRGLNGILADEMGLGKTIQTIALLGHLACEKNIWGPHLIVVPTSVMLNWEIEFKKFLPGFKILTYFGSPKERREKRIGWSHPNSFHVCIVSYTLVLQDASVFRKKNWHYLILDEAHQIKNFKSQRWQNLLTFKTERRLLLTGTPLQNDLIELWSLLHFLMPTIFTSHSEFQEWFSEPLSKAIENSNLDSHRNLIHRLHALIKPFLLRRLKRDVEKQMPSKYEHVIPVSLSRRQKSLYNEFMNKRSEGGLMNVLMQLRKICNHPELLAPREVRSSYFFLEKIDKYIPKICFLKSNLPTIAHRGTISAQPQCRPRLWNQFKLEEPKSLHPYFEKFETNDEKKILETRQIWPFLSDISALHMIERIQLPPKFIYSAIERMRETNLEKFAAYTIPVLVNSGASIDPLVKEYYDLVHSVRMLRTFRLPEACYLQWDSGKFIYLKQLLLRLQAGNHKVILFTQMSRMLDIIEAFANQCGFTYVRLDGSTKVTNRQLVVDKFNNDKRIFLFISSTRSGGVGINLTSADSVVFFDSDWNPAMDKQAMDRCHRIGQMRDVNIYRLVSEKTIEENIFAKQLQKRKLDDVVLDSKKGGSFDDPSVRVEELLCELEAGVGGIDRSEIYGTHILWEREEVGGVLPVQLLTAIEDPEDVIVSRKTHHRDEDESYLKLPEIIRLCVSRIVDEQVGPKDDEEEWDLLEEAEWDSNDDSNDDSKC